LVGKKAASKVQAATNTNVVGHGLMTI